jgi:hypothetical protein
LLSKLEFYGIVGKANALVKSYLKDRYQRVLINNWHSHSEWGVVNNGVPQGSILGPLLFLLYINDLPYIIISKSKPVLFADDTSIIITNSSPVDFKNNIIQIFKDINDWFKANSLTLNFDKTYFIKFLTKNCYAMDIHIDYCNNQITEATNTRFLGLIINNTLWKGHVDWLMSKLSSACYAIRAIKPYMSQETLRMIYFSYFHSVMTYSIIFWGNSPLVSLFLGYRKELLELLSIPEVEILARNCSRN